MTKLEHLYADYGQSPWLDNLTRASLRDGTLARMVDNGIRGVTANPTIFARSISGSHDYDAQFASLMAAGKSVEGAYWELVISDIGDALAVLRPLFDVDGSADARYAQIIEAYQTGLEKFTANGGDPTTVNSVASFFVSRVDTEVDHRLEAIGTDEALALRGQAAVAQAKLAYRLFTEQFSTARWNRLGRLGSDVQRPLWASTSTKDPKDRDTRYVDELVGPDSVTTLPEATIASFEDHGALARTVDSGVPEAAEVMLRLSAVGIDMTAVGRTLEDNGIAGFGKACRDVLANLTALHTDRR